MNRRLCLSAPDDASAAAGRLVGAVEPENNFRVVTGPTRQSYTRAWRLKYKLG